MGEAAIRPATPDDAPAAGRLIDMAGGGVYAFMLDGVAPGLTAAEMLAAGVADTAGSFSHRHMAVAEAGGVIVGLVHAYPADWMRGVDRSFIPADRTAHLAPFDEAQDWGSYFLSALAVDPPHRRQGLARRLLAWAEERARTAGFDRMSLHVWADNHPAHALYLRESWTEQARTPIPWHSRLPHEGGTIRMGKRV